MTQAGDSCRHPGDSEGCSTSLTRAWEAKALAPHCILDGLASGNGQCRQVLLLGLLAGDPACQDALHLGYQRDISAAKDVFVEAYKNLIWSLLRGLEPADADDIFQTVFLGMHQRLKDPAPIRCRLSAYVGVATRNAIGRVLGKRIWQWMEEVERLGGELKDTRPTCGSWAEGRPVGLWEECDGILLAAGNDPLVNRVIFAQGFVCYGGSKKRMPTREMLGLWRKLAASDPAEALAVASEAAVRLAQNEGTAVVRIADDMLREERAQPWQLPLILGQDFGLGAAEVLRLFGELAGKAVDFVDMRSFRITRLLAEHLRGLGYGEKGATP